MAKKSQVTPAPEMTALPISNGDSPLVIDLPDGQKLVVGNLAAGSVIEVATWRGTGRPDSRTSRLMLGMSSASATPTPTSTEATSVESKNESATIIQKASLLLNLAFKRIESLVASRKKLSGKKNSVPFIETVSPAANRNESAEVDDWLNSILEKSAKKQASVAKSESKPAAKSLVKPSVKKDVVKKSAVKKVTTGRKR